MDIRQLRYFIVIAEEQSISAAAKRLHMAQTPLSQQLKNMEQELGVCLANRSGKKLELTDAGKTLYNHALHITNAMAETEMVVKEIGRGIRGKIKIGVNTLSSEQLPRLLHQFQLENPNLSYKIQQNESDYLCEFVRNRTIDMAVIRMPLETNGLSFYLLANEAYYLLTSNKEERISTDKVTFEQIQPYPLILPSAEGLGLYHMIVKQLSQRQMEANIVCECSDIPLLLRLVESGFGAAIVPESVLRTHRGYHIHSYPLLDTSFTAASALVWLKDHRLPNAAQKFIDYVMEQLHS
ncbi:LysR family transcriptional regulator [Paenibacillus sp. N1-5-1-14]|uniref:LysR family transcriptional regulator n=1 Tax=Paenibacillus radicibacter TaxID=2972488 RepID=UPI002158A924|nr:LysR family transcriptional regulator [Paenibacillus radicibacter]MCR8643618.1 LysR family transcriptional regulator [Paenibacillus radicibacter]